MGSPSLSTYKSSLRRHSSCPLEDGFGESQFIFSFRSFVASLDTNGRTVFLIRIKNGFGNADGNRLLASWSGRRSVGRRVVALLGDIGESRRRNSRGSNGSRIVAVANLATQYLGLSINLVDLLLLLQEFVL
jgi:hypothetical protein